MTTSHSHRRRPLFDPPLVRRAIVESLVKLDPRYQIRNPVMFTVLVGSVATTLLLIQRLAVGNGESPWFMAGINPGRLRHFRQSGITGSM
jgi:K+-transporting ATPase ATPase B chain